jgi:polyisoprenoid-binding protein YceI
MKLRTCMCCGWNIAALVAAASTMVLVGALVPMRGAAAEAAAGSPAVGFVTEAATFRIDPVHTTAVFRIKHNDVAYFYGRFNEIAGSIDWDADSPSNSRVAITIKAESIDSGNDRRDDHLRSPDFFNVREFPEIRFTSTTIEKTGEKVYAVTGDLTLHGVTKPVTVELRHTGSAERRGRELVGFESVFTIKRSEFRMRYGIEQGALGDEVRLQFGIEGIRQ